MPQSPPAWATEPPVWGEPVTWDKVRRTFEEWERKKVYRYADPADGRQYELEWYGPTAAKGWANYHGHRYLGEVPRPNPRAVERGTADRGTEPPLSPPPLVKADPPPPRRPPPPKRKPEPVLPAPAPKRRPPPGPPPQPDEYGIVEYLKKDFLDTTMKESMPLISKWFGGVGKALKLIPGLQVVGQGYETVAAVADGLSLVYELVKELDQADAAEKGGKQLVKRTKPVKKIADRLLKKKFPKLPDAARKKAAELLETIFEKYVSDPLIEKGKKEAQERDEGKDLDKTLFEDLKKLLETPPTITPGTAPSP